MKTFHWSMQDGYPHTKVFVLGIWLTLLGTACIVVSIIGIIKLAWGYYIGTGMWGGLLITMAGLATMYSARVRTSCSAKTYLTLSVLDIPVSFAMLVLSAGGLTYKSSFYTPVRFDTHTHQMTLFLHGSLLGISVLSLALNILSVIVCLKFVTFEKKRRSESFKLRKRRRRFSDPNGVYRTGSLREGLSGGAARFSTSSRVPLFGSDRSRHSQQSSYSDSSSLPRSSGDRSAHRRDSDRSRGSSRSRPSHSSHHRQSSSASQQSRYESLHSRQNSQQGGSDSVYSTLSRENHRHLGLNGGDSFLHPSQAATGLRDGGEHVIIQPVFDSDEEPVPPYEETVSNTGISLNNGDESDIDNSDHTLSATLDNSSRTLFGVSHLPLNIPVTEVVTPHCRQRPDSLQLATSGYSGSQNNDGSRVESMLNGSNCADVGEHDNRMNSVHGAVGGHGTSSASCSYSISHPFPLSSVPVTSLLGHGGVITGQSLANLSSRDSRSISEVARNRLLDSPENRVTPEICALTGERETPSTLRGSPNPSESSQGPESSSVPSSGTLTGRESSQVAHLNHSSDSSDTSLPDRDREAPLSASSRHSASKPHSLLPVAGRRGGDEAELNSQAAAASSPGNGEAGVSSPRSPRTRAAPLTLGSPHSAFRPVGRTVPVSQISPSTGAPLDRFFSPIADPTTAHSSNLETSSESLSRGSALSWKMIPLPSSHNHSSRASSVPTKEVTTKSIPLPGFHSPSVDGHASNSRSLLGRNLQAVMGIAGDVSSTSSASRPVGGSHISAPRGASNAVLDSSLQFSTLPLHHAPGSDQQQSARNNGQPGGTEHSLGSVDGRDARQRHTVEVPSSVQSRPSVASSSANASGLNARWRTERGGSDRREDAVSVSVHSSGQSQSVGTMLPSRLPNSGQSSVHAYPPQPLSQLRNQAQRQQAQRQPHQQQLLPPQQQQQQRPQLPVAQQPQQQQQPQPQPQPAQQQNRPLFSVLL